MRVSSSRFKLLAVAASCVALGAGISAITSAGASTSAHASRAHSRVARAGGHHVGGHRGGLLRGAVSGQLVVKTKTGFANVSFVRGTVVSVSGQQLTLTEGTKQATYKTVTLTIPTTARVRDDRQVSSLSKLTAGQRVDVLTLPQQTVVSAHTPKTS